MIKSDIKYCTEFIRLRGCNLNTFREPERAHKIDLLCYSSIIILESSLRVQYLWSVEPNTYPGKVIKLSYV